MELFQRIRQIAQELAGSETKLAEKISLPQRKFNGYLNPISEKNLWQHLHLILEAYPQVSRDWLWFGEGEMLMPEGGSAAEAKPMGAAAVPPSEREAALARENAVLRDLVDNQKETIASQRELLSSQKDTIASQKETIAMQKLMLQQASSPFTPSDGPAQAGGPRVATASPVPGVRMSKAKPKIER